MTGAPTMLPPEMASAVNLMAHPAAGVVAFAALGFGLASHAAGTWIGAVSVAAEVSQRVWQPLVESFVPDADTRAGRSGCTSQGV